MPDKYGHATLSESVEEIVRQETAPLRERIAVLEAVCARYREALETGMGMPFCTNGWRGEDHEACIQQLEVWRATFIPVANSALASDAETREKRPG